MQLFLLNLFALTAHFHLSLSCSAGWKSFQGNCYKFGANSKQTLVEEPAVATWYDARLVCLNLGADLVSIHSTAENEFVRKEMKGDSWLGYFEQKSSGPEIVDYWWSDGSSTHYDYENWAYNRPHYGSGTESGGQTSTTCAFMYSGLPHRGRRWRRHSIPSATIPGRWFGSVQCATAKKYYVCKKSACCQDLVAVANLVSNSDRTVTGTVLFHQLAEGGETLVRGVVKGLQAGSRHGFHIHQQSDNTLGCSSYGGHYNPFHAHHSGRFDSERHVGDLGNIEFEETGVASFTFRDSLAQLLGPQSVLNRGVVIHARGDDLGKGGDEGSRKTGNAGHRVACGPILCRSCMDNLAAEAHLHSDDGNLSGVLALDQVIYWGVAGVVSGNESGLPEPAEYTHSRVTFLSYDDYSKADKKCDRLSTPPEQAPSPRDRTSGIIDLIGQVAVYHLSQVDSGNNVTKTATLCGPVWPVAHVTCACADLKNNENKLYGHICFSQQSCGGPVKIVGKLSGEDLPSSIGFSKYPYGLSTDVSCPAEDYDTWHELSSHLENGSLVICDESSLLSLTGFGSDIGRSLIVSSGDEDSRKTCGTISYRPVCPSSSCN